MAKSTVPGDHPPDRRPPIESIPPAPPGTGLRLTVHVRPWVTPQLRRGGGGYPASHPYVRRYWTAVLGAPAVSDLLRMVAAARAGRTILRPINLTSLALAGLVSEQASVVMVGETVPLLPPDKLRHLSPSLRRQHRLHEAFWVGALSEPGNPAPAA